MIKALILAVILQYCLLQVLLSVLYLMQQTSWQQYCIKTVKYINSFVIMQRRYVLPGLQPVFLR